MEFGFLIGIIEHLQLVTTRNYNRFTILITLEVTELQHTSSLLGHHWSLFGYGSQQCLLLM